MSQHQKEVRIPSGDSSKRVLFGQSSQVTKTIVRPSQNTSNLTATGSSKIPKDMSSFEWALHYHEKAKRLLLLLGKTVGDGVIEAGHAITYGKVLRFDYEDEDSSNYIVRVDTSKGERAILLSEHRFVLGCCQPEEIQHILSKAENMIPALHPFISDCVTFEDSQDDLFENEAVALEPAISPVMKSLHKGKKKIK